MVRASGVGGFLACALVAMTTPAAAQIYGTINLQTGFMPDPQRFSGTAGGSIMAQGVQADCRGWIPPQPSHVLLTSTGFSFLRVFAESGGDTTLMIRGTTQTWCSDDTYGLNPGLDLTNLPPGRYDVYVGSYAQGQTFPYQLAVSELSTSMPVGSTPNTYNPQPNTYNPQPNTYNPQPNTYNPQPNTYNPQPNPGVEAALNLLRPSIAPMFGRTLIARTLRGARLIRGRAGGDINASSLQGEGTCRGYINPQPDHVITLGQPQSYLHVFVVSPADTTLIIRRPDGTLLCNDDTYGLNPSLDGEFTPGTYQVWVGGYNAGENRPYRMTITADASIRP